MLGLFTCTACLLTCTALGGGMWEVWVAGLEQKLGFLTHLTKSPGEFLLPNYLSISQPL